MWLLVLVVLLLPAVVAVPVLPGEGGVAAVVADEVAIRGGSASQTEVGAAGLEGAASGATFRARIAERGKPGLVVAWLSVASVLLGWTLARALRFRRWLARTSLRAPPQLRNEVAAIGHRLGLARMPAVRTTTARVSPMVYWAGGKQGLKAKNRPGGEVMRTRAKLGEMTMRVELQAKLLKKGGYGDELRKLLRRLDG